MKVLKRTKYQDQGLVWIFKKIPNIRTRLVCPNVDTGPTLVWTSFHKKHEQRHMLTQNSFPQETWTYDDGVAICREQFCLDFLLVFKRRWEREREREREREGVYFLFFVSLLFCTVFSLDNEKNIHVIMELARYKPLCPVRCLWGIWVSQDFWTSSETGTMACTWHAPEHNGFHTMWACGFALVACRFCTMGMLILNNG
jgi:hypothetical protein